MELRERGREYLKLKSIFESVRPKVGRDLGSWKNRVIEAIEQAGYLPVEPIQLEALTDEEILSVLLTVYPGQYSGDSGNWLAPKEREFISSLTQATIAKNQKLGQLYRRKET